MNHISKTEPILIGFCEIANNIKNLKGGFDDIGVKAETVVYVRNSFYKYNHYDYILAPKQLPKNKFVRWLKRKIVLAVFFFRSLPKYKGYVYFWHNTYLPFKLDWLILRLLKKPFCVFFCGSDIRHRPVHIAIEEEVYSILRVEPENRAEFVRAPAMDFFVKLFRAKYCELLCDNIFTTPDAATFLRKNYYRFNVPIDFNALPSCDIYDKENDVVRIVYAPSSSIYKNSTYIMKVLKEQFGNAPGVELILINKASHEELMNILVKSHILIDQVHSWYGTLAIEAMHLGCVVFGGNNNEYQQVKHKPPIIHFDFDESQFKKKLNQVIRNNKLRQFLAKRGQEYVRENHSSSSCASDICLVLDGKGDLDQSPVIANKYDYIKAEKSKWKKKILLLTL